MSPRQFVRQTRETHVIFLLAWCKLAKLLCITTVVNLPCCSWSSVSLPPQVMWLPDAERQLVRQVAPGFQQTSGFKLDSERMREKGIVKLNLRYTKVTNEDVRYSPLLGHCVIAHVAPWWMSAALCILVPHSIFSGLLRLSYLHQGIFSEGLALESLSCASLSLLIAQNPGCPQEQTADW